MCDEIKLLHISSTALGGVGLHLLHICSRLNGKGFKFSVAIQDDNPDIIQKLRALGIKVYPLSIKRSPLSVKNMKGFVQLLKIMKKGNYNIVHTHTSVGGAIGRIAAKIAGVPIVLWTIHGWAFDYPIGGRLKRGLFYLIERFLDKFTDHYIAVSQKMKDVGLNSKIVHNEKRISVIYHGIDLDEVSKNRELGYNKLNIPYGFYVVGTVGRLETQKGIDIFLRAAKLIRNSIYNTKFVIIGDGPLRQNLSQLADMLGLSNSVIFTGWREDAYDLIRMMDVFCLASRWEAFGIVLLEAMAMGKPIVATNVGGVPEIVTDRINGFITKPEDPKDFAKKVILLLKDPRLCEEMKKKNLEKINKMFLLSNTIEKYKTLYRNLYINAL